MLTNDPNSYQANEEDYKKYIKEVLSYCDYLSQRNSELCLIENSKAWRAVKIIRRYLPVTIYRNIKTKFTSSRQKPVDFGSYNSHYEENIDFSKMGLKPEVKALAFYLPQFHTFKENDEWWGKGFTEWTNTKKSKPRFDNHYQPREPHDDFGYYRLDNEDSILKQVNLAKQHGIFGFCFYYYWFSGKRLMKKPLDIYLNSKEIDFPFCLCWANENWTRSWDGMNNDVLIEQKYRKGDAAKFIRDMKKYLISPKYIRVDGKPLILVYNPASIPNFDDVVETWRKTAREIKIGEIVVWSKNTMFSKRPEYLNSVDGEFDFAAPGHSFDNAIIEQNDEQNVFDYHNFVTNYFRSKFYYNHYAEKPFYYSCTMGWDNSARRKSGYSVLQNFSPDDYYLWMRLIIEETKRRNKPENRFVFINAWNEWAEGSYLEPDKKYGYTNINTTSKAIYGLPYNEEDFEVIDKSSSELKEKLKIALHLHVYYTDVLDGILGYIENIPYDFDLFISTTSEHSRTKILNMIKDRKIHYEKLDICVVKNIGRDIYPFISQMNDKYQDYDLIGHFHTKKTVNCTYGNAWREHLYRTMIGSEDYFKRLFGKFNDPKVGAVIPTCYYILQEGYTVGVNRKMMNELLVKRNYEILPNVEEIRFPAGSMFWARREALKDLFELNLKEEDFPAELGQTDGTIQHALERLIGVYTEKSGFKISTVSNKFD